MRRKFQFYVYMMSDSQNKFLYVGVTNNLQRRVSEHLIKDSNRHTTRFGIKKLVYFEEYKYVDLAIHREKQLKKWKREWKNELISRFNPRWVDLTPPGSIPR